MRRIAVFLLAAAVLPAASVKDNGTALRSGCYEDSATIAMLAAGAPVTIRYALSGEAVPCYKVATEANGKKLEGYLLATQIQDTEAFDRARRSGAWIDIAQVMSAVQASTPAPNASLSLKTGASVATRAAALIEASQPGQALSLLEPELEKRRDPGLLALAGVAAWRADDSAKALEYWKASLDLYPNPGLESLYRQVQQEQRGDKSTERLMGMRVQLRYEGVAISADAARQMLGVLDLEFARISAELGCAAQERVIAVAQSPQAYRQTTNSAEWSGGQFDGKIRVPVFDGRAADTGMRRVLAHEMAHACLALLGTWPSWLHEGIAQELSGDRLDAATLQQLTAAAHQGKLPKLEQLGGDWSRLDTNHAQLAYTLSLAAVEEFGRGYAALGLRNLLRHPERLAEITSDLDRRLGLQ